MSTPTAATGAKKTPAAKVTAKTEDEHFKPSLPDLPKLTEFLTTATDLGKNIDKRLTGGLHGSLLERGSKLEDDKRFFQLPTLFEFREKLPEIQKEIARLIQLLEMDGEKPTKGAAKPSGGMMATMRTMMEQQFETKLRDRDIKIQRLEDLVTKLTEKDNARGGKSADLPGQNKKDSQAVKLKLYELEDRVTGFETARSTIDSVVQNLKTDPDEIAKKQEGETVINRALTRRMTRLETNQSADRAEIAKVKDQALDRHEALVAWVDKELKGAESAREALREELKTWCR
jgi:hypothetical protein